MLVLRLLLMLVVTGEQYFTSPVHRKLFIDESNREDDNAMWNDAYFDKLFNLEKRAELPAPVNDNAEEADDEPEDEDEEEYEIEEEAADATDEDEPQLARSIDENLETYENFNNDNSYGDKRARGKFKREDIVKSEEEDCEDGATEALQYFDYDPEESSSGKSRYFRRISYATDIIAVVFFLFLVG